jgi:hypothetical protein
MSRRTRSVVLAQLAALAAFLAFASTCGSVAAPAPVVRRPRIEVCLCLDTTASMTGLLDAVRRTFWSICNRILDAWPRPDIKVALVAFRDRGDDYVTRVHDLHEDLDGVYADLRTFVAAGGGDTPESVNQALHDAVNKVGWSKDSNTKRIIFLVGDAPPHMDYSDDVKYPVTCAKARRKGIVINTVQAGTDAECARYWKEIAQQGRGMYRAVPLAGGVPSIRTPFDSRLREINRELVRNTIVFGGAARREFDQKNLKIAADLPAEVAADRAGYLARVGRTAPCDLIDALRAGKVRLETLRIDEMPGGLRKLSAPERDERLDRVGKLRDRLLEEAWKLDQKRRAFIANRMLRDRVGFDDQVVGVLHRQVRSR